MRRRINGMGSLVKLSDGRYRLKQQCGFLPNGKPRILTVTAGSETACIKKMHKRQEELESIALCEENFGKITLASLCYNHLEKHLSEVKRLKPKSADRREGTIRNQIEPYKIGKIQAKAVTRDDISNHIELLISEGELSVSSIVKTLNVINSAYKWACDQGYLNTNPCTPVLEGLRVRLRLLESRNSSDGVVIVLSREQKERLVKTVWDTLDTVPAYRAIFNLSVLLLLYTGMRVGELCALRWSDWSPKTNTISITKTRNVAKNRYSKGKGDVYIPNENEVKNCHSRTIELSADAKKVVERIYEISPKHDADDYILLNRKLTETNPSNYDTNLKPLYKAAGYGAEISGAHVLRRTCATDLHEDGYRIETIAAYLGDLPETIRKHYISMTKKLVADGEVKNAVSLKNK